jgi:hypothetical protein
MPRFLALIFLDYRRFIQENGKIKKQPAEKNGGLLF